MGIVEFLKRYREFVPEEQRNQFIKDLKAVLDTYKEIAVEDYRSRDYNARTGHDMGQ